MNKNTIVTLNKTNFSKEISTIFHFWVYMIYYKHSLLVLTRIDKNNVIYENNEANKYSNHKIKKKIFPS